MPPDIIYALTGIDIDDRYDSIVSVLVIIIVVHVAEWAWQRRSRPTP